MEYPWTQSNDLPLIPSFYEDRPLAQWSNDNLFHSQGHYHPVGRAPGIGREEAMHSSAFSSLQPMQRFLNSIDPSPFVTGTKMHRANLYKALPVHGMQQYEYSWPTPDRQYYSSRNDSPDRTSVSTSSHGTSNDLHSLHQYNQNPYNSSVNMYYATSYSSAQHSHEGQFASEMPLRGGICPRDVEYEHLDFDPTAEEQETLDANTASCDPHDSHMNYYSHSQQAEADRETYKSNDYVSAPFKKEESVRPAAHGEEDSDSEYMPKSNRKKRGSASSGSVRSKRSSRGRKNSAPSPPATTTRAYKRSPRGSNAPSTAIKSPTAAAAMPATIDNQRPFPCSLANYGCTSNFASKNEWKRHMSTQHIKLGFWRCDLCSTTVDPHDKNTIYHNDFNRKDLFTQHLRRMHADPSANLSRNAASANRSSSSYGVTPLAIRHVHAHHNHNHVPLFPVTEDNISTHQKRCYRTLRQSPPRSSCLFCDKSFSGPSGWEDRMEHVGRHLEKECKPEMLDLALWKPDEYLQAWLLEEGLVDWDEDAGWRIGNGKPRRDSVLESGAEAKWRE